MNFEIGQIFEDAYPPECAVWCNENNAYIEEIEPIDGIRRFEVKAIPEPTQEEIQARLTQVVQKHLDAKAQELLYDDCNSVCTYIDTGVPKFDDEGRAFRAWRSAVWAKCYEILDEVKAGTRSIPTEEELIAELPELTIAYSV